MYLATDFEDGPEYEFEDLDAAIDKAKSISGEKVIAIARVKSDEDGFVGLAFLGHELVPWVKHTDSVETDSVEIEEFGERKIWHLSQEQYDKLNPPDEEFRVVKEDLWTKELDGQEWLRMGYIPTPRNYFEWLFYHFVHGVLMRYPLHKVILYCLNRDAWCNHSH